MKKSYLIIVIVLIMILLVAIVVISKTTYINSNSIKSMLDTNKLFSSRDLEQCVDSNKVTKYYTLSDNTNIEITTEGIYVISGTANNSVIIVDVKDDEKVQLILDGVKITNENTPCIYLKNADKLFITTNKDTENSLAVTETFTKFDGTNTDAVIYAKDDITINGEGKITINSSDNGISCNNDIKITGSTINITCISDAIEAKDSIRIADGSITINSQKDGLHAENSDDDTTGYIYIGGGKLDIKATANCIHATTIAQINNGEITLDGWEGIEATYVQINGGTINIDSDDDCINAGAKSNSYKPTIEIVNGNIKVKIADGDTDAIDSNGNIYIKGGTLDITAQNPFDYDGEAEYTGGAITVNGTIVKEIAK